jgi:hypothetical protein
MRRLICASVLAVVVISFGPRAIAEVNVAAILQQHVDSRGGSDRIQGLLGYQLRGTFSQGGRTLPFHMWWKQPNKLRTEVGNGSSVTVSAYDGTKAWTVEPGPWGSQASGMMPGVREMFIRQAEWEGPFLNTEKKGIHLTPVDSLWGDNGYLFKVQRGSGEPDLVLLNSSMRLVSKEVFTAGPPGFEHRVERRYSNFRRVEGFAFPHRVEQFVDGGTQDAILEVAEVIIGPAISDSLFVMPEIHYPQPADVDLVDMPNLSALHDHFLADAGKVRLVAILSPTASTSRRELFDLRAVLDSAQDDRIAAYVVWTPVLESDSRAAAAARKSELDDPRVTFLWDPHSETAKSLHDALQLKSNALNLCCLYSPDAQWDSTPGSPDYWTQPAMGDPATTNLDQTQSLDRIREMLAKIPQDKKKHGAKTSQR